MSESEERALSRLAWKPTGTDAVVGPLVAHEEEIRAAEVDLEGTIPLLVDRRAREA